MDVFVVEDEPLVREIITESLQETGLEVGEAASAEAALEALAAHGGKPPSPVLVTDVNLGHSRMDGIALAAELRHRWPALGVVVISGQEANLARSAALAPNERHLFKPFSPDALVHAVHELGAPAMASAR